MSLPTEHVPRAAALQDRSRDAGGDAPAREFTPRDMGMHVVEERKPIFRWDLALVWFMRLVGLVWVAKSLVYWAILLGVMPGVAPFEEQPLQWQAIIVYFAVIDPVAAVGLWLTSTWGGVMWLLAAISCILAGILAPHAVVSAPILLAGVGALVGAYFLLSWYASRIEA